MLRRDQRRKPESILIIGGGTWGINIAYQLAHRGFSKIIVLDAEPFPSPIAAGNDLNKIVEEPITRPDAKQDDKTFTWASIETLAYSAWTTDELFKPYFHPTGFIYAAVGDDAYKKVTDECEGKSRFYTPLEDVEHFRSTMPKGVLTGELKGWRGFWRKEGAGWVEARNAMTAVKKAAQDLGVEFITGVKGRVSHLLYNESNDDVVGAVTESGVEYKASQIILSAGASSDRLLDFRKQLRPTAWTLAHIPLSKEEASFYRNLPVLYGVDRGFFIEPPTLTADGIHELKICDEHPGYINFVHDPLHNNEKRSIPFARHQIPQASATRIQNFLRETMPQLAEREFSFARICWDADTVDRLFLIGHHPEFPSLTVAAGGSGHGYMCSPAVGMIVADLLDGKLVDRMVRTLGWREEQAVDRDWWDTQGRFGVVTEVMDFQDVKEWTQINESWQESDKAIVSSLSIRSKATPSLFAGDNNA